MARSVKYSPLEVHSDVGDAPHGAKHARSRDVAAAAATAVGGATSSPTCLERRCALLPAAQVATAFIPVAFTDAVLAELLPVIFREVVTDKDESAQQLLPTAASLAGSLAGLLLSASFGVMSERCCQGCCGGRYRWLIVSATMLTLPGQLLVAWAIDLGRLVSESLEEVDALPAAAFLFIGSMFVGIAHAAMTVALRARLGSGVLPARLGTVFAMAAVASEVGDALGRSAASVEWGRLDLFKDSIFTTEACSLLSYCFNLRLCLIFGNVLSVLGGSLAALAGTAKSRKAMRRVSAPPPISGHGHKVGSASHASSNMSSVEQLLEEPGARALVLASFLSWSSWWAMEAYVNEFVTGALEPNQGADALRRGRWLRIPFGAAAAIGLPRLLEWLGGFGTWLPGSLVLAVLLLCCFPVRAVASPTLVVAWLGSFGAVWTLQLVVPFAALARRARARSIPIGVVMAVASVPSHAAPLCWRWFDHSARSMLGSPAAIFGAGAVLAVWSAAVCSYALACDNDRLAVPLQALVAESAAAKARIELAPQTPPASSARPRRRGISP